MPTNCNSYDANGNRLTQTGNSASTYAVASTSNRLNSTTGALARIYNYDAVGNVLTSGATIHSYNNRGRMRTGRLSSTGTNTNYVYNALGQRVRKSGGTPGTVMFVYDEAGHLVGEYTSTGTPVQETVWLGDIPVATIRLIGGVTMVFYVHTDQLNTPRKVTSTSNQLRWKWDPTPFGEGTPTEPAGAFKYNLRFPGQYFDLETNLNYNYFRDYDPAVGRYVQSDPIGLDGGINTYLYADAGPQLTSDPSGLVPGPNTGPRGFPSSHPHCLALLAKIERKRQVLQDRIGDYNADKGKLPERLLPKGGNEALSATRRGHRVLINKEDSSTRKLERRYAQECYDECKECEREVVKTIVIIGGIAVAVCAAPAAIGAGALLGGAAAAQ